MMVAAAVDGSEDEFPVSKENLGSGSIFFRYIQDTDDVMEMMRSGE